MKRVVVCVALVLWSGLASAVVYKWVDSQGKVQYGDRPPDGVQAEVVELLRTHTSARAAPAPGPAGGPQSAKAATGDPNDAKNVTDKSKQAVAADVAAARQAACQEAQARYKQLVEGRHIYKTGENGERAYLSAEEIDSERLNAKRDVDETCRGAT